MENNKNVYLYISTFNNDINWIKGAIPIEVGASIRNSFIYCNNKDNVGDNISDENQYWGELTGLYWLWKNNKFNNEDIIGFAHYNKIIDITKKKLYNFFDNNPSNSWVVINPCTMVKHSYINDIEILEKVLREKYSDYYQFWEKNYNSDGSSKIDNNCYNCEMFYTTYDEFSAYCKFLFDVLFDVYKIIGEVDRTPYHKRYLAFLGERLLTIYLEKNKSIVLESNIRTSRNKIIHLVKSSASKIRFLKNNYLYKKIKEKNNKSRKSSWSRK